MGPHFFHWKNKLWVRGGRSRLALSENLEKSAVYDRFMPSKPANLRDPYNITAAWAVDREFVIYSFLGVVGPMVPPGSPDALGKAKTKVFLRFFKVRSQKQ